MNVGNCTALGVAVLLSCGCPKRVVEAALKIYGGVNGTLTTPTGRLEPPILGCFHCAISVAH